MPYYDDNGNYATDNQRTRRDLTGIITRLLRDHPRQPGSSQAFDPGFDADFDRTLATGFDDGFDAGFERRLTPGFGDGFDAGFERTLTPGYDRGAVTAFGPKRRGPSIASVFNELPQAHAAPWPLDGTADPIQNMPYLLTPGEPHPYTDADGVFHIPESQIWRGPAKPGPHEIMLLGNQQPAATGYPAPRPGSIAEVFSELAGTGPARQDAPQRTPGTQVAVGFFGDETAPTGQSNTAGRGGPPPSGIEFPDDEDLWDGPDAEAPPAPLTRQEALERLGLFGDDGLDEDTGEDVTGNKYDAVMDRSLRTEYEAQEAILQIALQPNATWADINEAQALATALLPEDIEDRFYALQGVLPKAHEKAERASPVIQQRYQELLRQDENARAGSLPLAFRQFFIGADGLLYKRQADLKDPVPRRPVFEQIATRRFSIDLKNAPDVEGRVRALFRMTRESPELLLMASGVFGRSPGAASRFKALRSQFENSGGGGDDFKPQAGYGLNGLLRPGDRTVDGYINNAVERCSR